jgi:hypothetical protein
VPEIGANAEGLDALKECLASQLENDAEGAVVPARRPENRPKRGERRVVSGNQPFVKTLSCPWILGLSSVFWLTYFMKSIDFVVL